MRAIKTLQYRETYTPEHTYTFFGPCKVTGKEHSVAVKASELWDFNNSDNIHSFKSLSMSDREFLISGTSPEGWNQLFGREED